MGPGEVFRGIAESTTEMSRKGLRIAPTVKVMTKSSVNADVGIPRFPNLGYHLRPLCATELDKDFNRISRGLRHGDTV